MGGAASVDAAIMTGTQTVLAGTISGGATTAGGTGVPAQSGPVSVWGAYVGGGGTLTASNGQPGQLGGPFSTYAVNAGVGPLNFSFQLSCSGYVCQGTISPPGVSWGVGFSIAAYKTKTAVATTGCKGTSNTGTSQHP
jgi:hypothetical protein